MKQSLTSNRRGNPITILLLIVLPLLATATALGWSKFVQSTLPPDACPGGTWDQQAKIGAHDRRDNDVFGTSVAVSGDTAIVGAPSKDTAAGTNAGSAYIFVRSGGIWTLQAQIFASDGTFFDEFGISVAISGDTVVVGAHRDDVGGAVDAGSAYVFVRSGTVWTQQAMLTAAADGSNLSSNLFGTSVSIDGDSIIVGARTHDGAGGESSGAAYIFVRSGTVWTQEQELNPLGGTTFDFFGESVGISGNTAVVGAPGVGAPFPNVDKGAAYIFVRSGTTWTQQQGLTGTETDGGDHFGESVGISGDTAIIGAEGDDVAVAGQGSAFVFVRAGGAWSQQARLTAADAATEDLFGQDVAISGDRAIVGAQLNNSPAGGSDHGSAYIFTRTGTSWTQQQLVPANNVGGDQFGNSVGISDGTVIVGAHGDDLPDNLPVVNSAGSAYIFQENCPEPDGDGDGVPDASDNCPLASNPDQADNDGDALGDVCDTDDDNDGVLDTNDNCQFASNPDQADNDGDSQGDVCDPDDDNDGDIDGNDNCQFVANPDQADNDIDEIGDVCDPDDDNDGHADGDDAFPLDPNEWLDTDVDGTGNNADTDDDNDGQSDADEIACGSDPLNAASTATDTDSDGRPNCVDPDDDNDTFIDTVEQAAGSDPLNAASTPEVCDGIDNDLNEGVDEGYPNTDGDAQANCVDTDDDNDTFTDTAEQAAGSDPLNAASTPEVCDGVDNDLNDGVDEGYPNTDGDSQANCVDPDDDNDTFTDTAEQAAGSDPLNAASTPEVCDGIDNDLNDGIDEGYPNTDGDSQANCVDPDDDNDGVSDAAEQAAGSDPLNPASTPEVCDGVDNDLNDGIDEGFANTDGDSQANCVDPDDDNDGVSDATEQAAGSDPLNAASTPEVCDGVDNDLNDGIDEGFANTDGDSQANCVDPDDDNDGVTDTAEQAAGSDPLNAASTPEVCDGVDNDLNDGIDEGFANTDGDSLANCVDPDDDNDGQTDADEIACSSDPLSAASKSLDTDNDNIPNCVDTDDDNDGVNDANDAFPLDPNESVDTDGDGTGNNADLDDDSDGQTDADEIACGSDPLDAASKSTDTDNDNRPNCVDTDDDNDGHTDAAEQSAGSDPLNAASTPEVCDGVDNDLNDGVDEGFPNTDGDSQANCVDSDDDGDGHADSVEQSAGSDPLNAASTPEVCDGVDNDLNDGVDEGFVNTDGDSQADCVDPDDDNDGQTDADEVACGSDPLNAASKAIDTDNDNRPNCVDPDDDNDGVADTTDACPGTPAGTQVNAAGCPDSDGDGVADANDNCPLIANPDQADSDGDGIGNVCDTGTFNFTGFFQPVENLPVVNIATAGSAIPVKFSLGGNRGLNIFAPGYPASGQVACSQNEWTDVIEETVSPGSSTLSYDPTTDRYNYVWRTNRNWRGTCRLLIVRFTDGTERYAKFQFR